MLVIPLNITDEDVMSAAESIYDQLGTAGIDVLMDERKARPGFKFKDADLIGIPLRVIVGGKGLADGVVELKWRTDSDVTRIPLDQIVDTVINELAERTSAESQQVPE